ncbi:F-box protein At2g39490 [Pyrus x bretschneideri]|uniref:F-box protein At2g39490 n=1 Tax=Pyrus x bretschneideri TaxID=225117 RepID=UPI00202EF3E7|nr:F-box protein At2g39490 [Pyrus x bretschneideri]
MEKEIADDLFGKLPNEIICRIISFLPSESALETSLISSMWRGLWNTTLAKQITTDDDAADAVFEFVSHFNQHDPLGHPRKLQLHFGKLGDLLLATVSPNNKLRLEFSTENRETPRHFGWHLKLNHQRDQTLVSHQPSPSTFFVKFLYLKSVSSFGNEAVSSMIPCFEFLENLKIIECEELQSLHIESSPRLLSLTIFDCQNLKSLHLKTSKLRSFRYRGFLPHIWTEHHFNLADAMLDFRQGPGYGGFKSSDFDPMLLTIKNAQVLTLCKWTFQTLIWPSLLPLQANFIFYKLKELWWIDNWEERFSIDPLISFIKLCPALEQLYVTNDPRSYCMAWTAPPWKKVNGQTKLAHLKVIKLVGFTTEDDETTLAEYIRDLVTVEPLIISSIKTEKRV